MKTYELKFSPVEVDGENYSKWNVRYYDENGDLESVEFHSTDGVSGNVRGGYSQKQDI